MAVCLKTDVVLDCVEKTRGLSCTIDLHGLCYERGEIVIIVGVGVGAGLQR